MKYLSFEQLMALTPQRRYALLKSLKAKIGLIHPNFDFEPDMLTPEEQRLNDYRKKVHALVTKFGRTNAKSSNKRRHPHRRSVGSTRIQSPPHP